MPPHNVKGQVKNAAVYSKMMEALDAETKSRDELKTLSTAELLRRKRAKQEQRLEEMRKQAEVALRLEEEAKEKERQEREERERLAREEEERKRREAEEAAIAELERKTKKFFTLGKYGRKVETGVMYFGDYATEGDAWIPHGYGEYRINGEVIYDGEINHGKMQGVGTIKFPNDDSWKGTFMDDQPHGLGLYKFGDGKAPRKAIYRRSRRVCWLDDLVPGTRVRCSDARFVRAPTGTILSQTPKEGRYRVKFDQGPCLCLDLRIEPFEVINDQPRCAVLDTFRPHERFDMENRYDSRGRQTTSIYDENFFNEAVVKKKEARTEKQAANDSERWKRQQQMLANQLKTRAAAKKVKEEMEAALAAERKAKEEEEAERRAYEEELAAQKEALAAKRAQQEASLAANKG